MQNGNVSGIRHTIGHFVVVLVSTLWIFTSSLYHDKTGTRPGCTESDDISAWSGASWWYDSVLLGTYMNMLLDTKLPAWRVKQASVSAPGRVPFLSGRVGFRRNKIK